MSITIENEILEEELAEIKDFVTTLALLSKEDRAVLLSNAYAFRVRRDIETTIKNEEKDSESRG